MRVRETRVEKEKLLVNVNEERNEAEVDNVWLECEMLLKECVGKWSSRKEIKKRIRTCCGTEMSSNDAHFCCSVCEWLKLMVSCLNEERMCCSS